MTLNRGAFFAGLMLVCSIAADTIVIIECTITVDIYSMKSSANTYQVDKKKLHENIACVSPSFKINKLWVRGAKGIDTEGKVKDYFKDDSISATQFYITKNGDFTTKSVQ